MIAEYRRILKNPTPERKKKCIFFDALHKIYQAKDTNAVKAALNNYEEVCVAPHNYDLQLELLMSVLFILKDYNLDPIEFSAQDENEMNGANGDGLDGDNSGTDNEDRSEVFAYAMSPSQTIPNGNNHNHLDEDSADGQMNHIGADGEIFFLILLTIIRD